MAERKPLGLREVRSLAENDEFWDSTVAGFGARRQRSSAVAYVLLYRTPEGRQRRFTIGRHGAPWTPDTARTEAQRLLGEVAAGRDPAAMKKAKRTAAQISDLCDQYLFEAEQGHVLKRDGRPKKATTLASDKGRIEGHIKPLLGHLRVEALTKSDVENFMRSVAAGKTARQQKTKLRGLSIVRGGKGTATRAVGTLGAILSFAVERGLRADNPAHSVRRYADKKRERRLDEKEYEKLGNAFRLATELRIWPAAIAASNFLAITGWRRDEALALRWSQVDLARRTATLGDTKTGKSVRPLSKVACDLLVSVERGDDLVFPPSRGKTQMTGFRKYWLKICKLVDLPTDITPHILRHSFVSIAADLDYSEPTIAAMVGHKGRSVTSRYIHFADAVLLSAADRVADRISDLLGTAVARGAVHQLRA